MKENKLHHKVRIAAHCWEIMRAIEDFDSENGCVEDLEGDVLASVGDILYDLVHACDHNDISEMLNSIAEYEQEV